MTLPGETILMEARQTLGGSLVCFGVDEPAQWVVRRTQAVDPQRFIDIHRKLTRDTGSEWYDEDGDPVDNDDLWG